MNNKNDKITLWARVGMSIEVSQEVYYELLNGNAKLLQEVIAGEKGKAFLNGETYFPDVAENLGLAEREFDLYNVTPVSFNLNSHNEFEFDMSHYTEEIDFTKYDEMTPEELAFEKNDLLGAIANERVWQKSCTDAETFNMHKKNIEALQSELDYVSELINEHNLAGKPSLDNLITAAQNKSSKEACSEQHSPKKAER